MDLKGLRGVCKGKNFHNIVLCKKISKMDEKRGGRGISPFTYSLIQYLFYCIYLLTNFVIYIFLALKSRS